MLNICNFLISKVTKIIFLSSLFISSLFSSNLEETVLKPKLYTDSYWAKLLHYRNNQSEVDSDNFFISKNGKTNLKEELLETIKSLRNGTKNTLCRFPLRVKWLKEKIPALENQIINYECKDLDIYLKEIDAKYATLIFPASHINSPASMYGHTFLRLSADENTPLLGNAVNYAAQTDETNGLIFAYKGLFGGYKGKYSILPYYEKIKEYSNLEQRDIWEYKLDLTLEEVEKIALHSYELKDSYSFYYFFLENCSYNLLWLLEVAKEDLNLINHFSLKAVPLDTVKILKNYNLIKESNYRHSKMSKMKHILNYEIENKDFISEFIKDEKKLSQNLTLKDKSAYLDLKIEYIQYLRSKNKLAKSEYLKKYLKLLRQRSKLDIISDYDIKKPKDPIYSHDSARISLTLNSNDTYEISAKPVYSDVYDISYGYLEGAYIDFFDLSIKKDSDKLFIDKFKVLDINSFSKRDELFKPLSWGIELSYERFKSEDDYLKLKPSFGLTYGDEDYFIYALAQSNLYNKLGDNLISLGSKVGFVTNKFKDLKLGLSFDFDKYNKNFENKKFEAFSTFKINNDISLNIKYTNDNLTKQRDIGSLSLFYYF
ncbi:DUF4105 domain-containing protein [Arcobacter sp. YIC-464]|uniref:Lnb N-terminal periplasmic domain-containing protein n=1 Tax=Arcobacter sp. YIC-464 TaxID=3376631 RepID=UPI003C157098